MSSAPHAKGTPTPSPSCGRRARGAARLAPESAARWFGDALRLLPQNAPAEERIELLLARSGALTAAGHFADSHDALLEAVALAPRDARLARACAAVEGLLGRQEQAGARLASAIEVLPDQGSRGGGVA